MGGERAACAWRIVVIAQETSAQVSDRSASRKLFNRGGERRVGGGAEQGMQRVGEEVVRDVLVVGVVIEIAAVGDDAVRVDQDELRRVRCGVEVGDASAIVDEGREASVDKARVDANFGRVNGRLRNIDGEEL